MERDSLRPYSWMLMGCVSFTAMYGCVHELRGICDWEVIALFRAALACAFAVVLALAGNAKLVLFRPPTLWLRSIAGSVSLLCSFFAMTRNVPVSNVLAINNIFPIWMAILAWPILGMKPTWSVLVSVFTAVGGVMLIRSPRHDDPAALLSLADDMGLALLFSLIASFCTALAMLGLHTLQNIDARAVVAHFSGVSVLFCLGALWFSDPGVSLSTLSQVRTQVLLLGVGIAATVGQICLTKAFTIGAPAKVSVVGLTQIVMTLIVDVLWFGEYFTALNLSGMALVMAPTAWVMLSHQMRRSAVDQKVAKGESWTANADPPVETIR